jgi:hypothetical protein
MELDTQPPFEAYRGNEPFIFVSYSHKDGSAVFPDIASLQAQGYRIWYDEGIGPGNDWTDEIAKALAGSTLFLVFVSPHAIDSKNVRKEINFAISRDKPVLAVHIAETRLPPGLELQIGDIQAVLKYRLSGDNYVRKLARALPASLKASTAAYRGEFEPENDMAEAPPAVYAGGLSEADGFGSLEPIAAVAATSIAADDMVPELRGSGASSAVHDLSPGTTSAAASADSTRTTQDEDSILDSAGSAWNPGGIQRNVRTPDFRSKDLLLPARTSNFPLAEGVASPDGEVPNRHKQQDLTMHLVRTLKMSTVRKKWYMIVSRMLVALWWCVPSFIPASGMYAVSADRGLDDTYTDVVFIVWCASFCLAPFLYASFIAVGEKRMLRKGPTAPGIWPWLSVSALILPWLCTVLWMLRLLLIH